MSNEITDDFDESKCELVKYVILKKEIEDEDIQFTSIELHTTLKITVVLQGQSITRSKVSPYKYRVYTHQGTVSDTKDENSGIKKSYLAKTGPEALKIFQEQHDIWASEPHNMTKTTTMLSRWLGSNVLTKRLLESQASKGEVSSEVARLADNLWKESMGELSEVLTVPVKAIPLGKVEKAESVLLQIKRALLDKETKDDSVIHGLSEQFHELIPYKAECRNDLTNMRMVAVKQDLCQLIQDVINVNEALGWKKQPSAKSKYRAMRCYIESLDTDHPEYKQVEELVMSTTQPIDDEVSIQRIFAVNRALDEFKFNRTIGNERLLFHASKACNFLGILSRGILLPKIVVEMFGIDRWDAGMLGSGIYFGDCMSTCAKYSAPGKFTGTRFLAVNNVALGESKDIYEKRTDIESAPDGFNSVHGVRKTDQVESFFVDDEYVVYQANQHCLRYLVEFKLTERNSDETDNQTTSASQASVSDHSSTEDTDSDDDIDDEIDILDVQGMVYPEAKVKAGLNTTGEGQVELEAVHVRASIIDLAAEVIVLQKYRNVGEETADTRYVFPLDERAAVCGFDAYINGKRVIGIVKEKGQARKSYDKAKQEGHGAYLMEEEATNVFTITVGNLPPGSCVIISVRYVTELVIEGDRIAFNLLGSVAPWKKKEILTGKFDDKGDAVDGVVENQQNRSESFMARVVMPSNIRSVHCPTHSIKIQKKDEKLFEIAMCDGDRLVDGLQLLVDMDDAHKPRIWREKLSDDNKRQACMVVFYPEFPVTTISNPEVVIMLDRSTSMKGQPMKDAKKLVHMILESLPAGCRYNLVVFGNDFDELYPTSVLATDENIKHTETFLMTVTWERGATEVWRPLRAMSLLSSSDVRLTSNGFLISDGHVTNEQDTLLEVASNRQINRLFTFGVSSDSNRHVLRTLADTGGGAYEQFDPRSKSTWEAKVQAQVRRSCQPAATSIKVNWISSEGKTPRTLTRKEIVQTPSQIASLFTGSRLVLYAMGPEVTKVELEAEIEGRTESFTVTADLTPTSTGLTLHRLATRGIVRDWELGSVHANRLENDAMMDDVKRHLIELGVQFNIVSPLTSFIAIEERDEEDENKDTEGPSITAILEGLWPTPYHTNHPWVVQEASTGIETSCSMTQLNEALARAGSAQKSFSFITAEHQYKQAMNLATKSFEPLHPAIKKACLALARFHLRVKGEVQLANEVLNDYMQESKTVATTELDRKLTNMAKICKNLLNQIAQEEEGASKATSSPAKLAVDRSKEHFHEKEDLKTGKEQEQDVEATIPIGTRAQIDASSRKDEIETEEYAVEINSESLSAEEEMIIAPMQVDDQESMPDMYGEEEDQSPDEYIVRRVVRRVVHSAKMTNAVAEPYDTAVAEPVESARVEYIESDVMELRAASPLMLEAERSPSPVMLQAQRAQSPVQMVHAVQSAQRSYATAMAEPVESARVEYIESDVMELRAASPVMLEAELASSPVMLQAQRAQSPVQMVHAVQSAQQSYAPDMAKPVESARVVCIESDVMELRAASPLMLEAERSPSPVMLQARRAQSPVQMVHAVQSAQRSYATVMAEPVESARVVCIESDVMELRAASPVMLEAERASSPVMLQAQRAQSPVQMVHAVQSAQWSYATAMAKPVESARVVCIESDVIELRAASPVMLEAERSPSPVMLQAQRAQSPVQMVHAVQSAQRSYATVMAEPVESARVVCIESDVMELRAASPVMLEAERASSPVMLQARRAESHIQMVHAVQSVQRSYATAMAEPVESARVEYIESDVMELRAASPVMLEAELASSPVMLQAQRAESHVQMVHAVQSVQARRAPSPVMLQEVASELEPYEAGSRVQMMPSVTHTVCRRIESDEVRLRVASPVRVVARRAQSPVMLQDVTEHLDLMMSEMQSDDVGQDSTSVSMLRKKNLESEEEELRAASPVMLEAERSPSPVMLQAQRAEFPVLMMRDVQSAQLSELDEQLQENIDQARQVLDVCAPYKTYLTTSQKDREDDESVDEIVKDPDEREIETMRRLLKISNEDDDGWWTWDLTDFEKEFGVDCSEIVAVLQNPTKSFSLDESLADKWMSSMDLIRKIVAAALVLSIFDMWISLVEPNVSTLIHDNSAILFIPAQIQEWLKHCLPGNVSQLYTIAFGETTTWASILKQFPSDIIEVFMRPIRHCMTKTR
ncbi:uncharacterized protein LOC579780 isoform X3 [Strongylocentrotus purpuratus]|nr:uncharacterized protein LOC579780 isoform X3 [Strongylocentrotus purpuratus]